MTLDPRLYAYRADLADIRLKDHVEAKRFVNGKEGKIVAPIANVYAKPDNNSPQTTQGLLGEAVTIYDTAGEWHWIQFHHDGYVGYVSTYDIDPSPASLDFTHRVTAPLAHIYARPDIKSQPLELLPMGAQITCLGSDSDEWLSLSRGGYIKSAMVEITSGMDPVNVAARLIGAPYLWGGRSAVGIDCSGLVQLSFAMCGFALPRDSDQQETFVEQTITTNGADRGDLVFFKGHVGIMWDRQQLLHANATTMNVALEPLAKVAERAAITSVRRPVFEQGRTYITSPSP